MSDLTGWQRSSFCGGGDCVEVRAVETGGHREVLVRSSVSDGALRLSPDEWRSFTAGVKDGQFDLDE